MSTAPSADVVTVLMTAPNTESAEFLGRALVEERLAACANIVPGLRSIYWWKGEVQQENEALLILKTRPDAVEALTARAVTLHPFEVPEVLVLPVVGGHAAYMKWVAGEVG